MIWSENPNLSSLFVKNRIRIFFVLLSFSPLLQWFQHVDCGGVVVLGTRWIWVVSCCLCFLGLWKPQRACTFAWMADLSLLCCIHRQPITFITEAALSVWHFRTHVSFSNLFQQQPLNQSEAVFMWRVWTKRATLFVRLSFRWPYSGDVAMLAKGRNANIHFDFENEADIMDDKNLASLR